jgi:hypothetical protein
MTVIAGLENFVPMVCQWQLQSEKDIYDSIDDWTSKTFLCIMKDGKEVRAYGIMDEGYSGEVSTNLFFEDEDYSEDDVLFWMEIPCPPKADLLKIWKKNDVKDFISSSRCQFNKELTENMTGVIWHDLRKNPQDLPSRKGFETYSERVITDKGYGIYNFRKCKWYVDNPCDCMVHTDVIAWTKIPKFEEV